MLPTLIYTSYKIQLLLLIQLLVIIKDKISFVK